MSATESPYRQNPRSPESPPTVSLKPAAAAVFAWCAYMVLSILGLHAPHTWPWMELSLLSLGIVACRAVFRHGFVNGEREEHKRWLRKIDPDASERLNLDPVVVQAVISALTSKHNDLNAVSSALDALRRDLAYAQMIAELNRKP